MRSRRRQLPVLVLPGLGGGDGSTVAIRAHLNALGHPVHRWQLGRNEGPTPEMVTELGRRFDRLLDRYDQPVAMVGWSLGGVYAVALAERNPAEVEQVITLGSPLARWAGGASTRNSVPLTSIWSRLDRIVNWRNSLVEEGPRRENIEVRATHLTLGVDPLVLGAVADRLGQPEDDWKPFRPPPWLRSAYPKPRTARS